MEGGRGSGVVVVQKGVARVNKEGVGFVGRGNEIRQNGTGL